MICLCTILLFTSLFFQTAIATIQEPSIPYCTAYLVRHGQTDLNAQGIIQGQGASTNGPLNTLGIQQALQLKERIKDISFACVAASDLTRAQQTAGLLSPQIITSSALRERYMGIWEGKKTKDVRQKYLDDGLLNKSHEDLLTYTIDNIESYKEVYARSMEYIKTLAQTNIGKNVLVVTHGGVMRSVLYTHDFRSGYSWGIENCTIVTIKIFSDGVVRLDDHTEASLTLNGF